MDENEKIEKGLKEFREARDRQMPADRRLLPVHKDRLLGEARRRYGAQSVSSWIAFLRPAVRWAVVSAPVLILALAGYFWFQDRKSERVVTAAPEQEKVVLLDHAEFPLGSPRKSEDRARALGKADMDTVAALQQAPAEMAAGDGSNDELKRSPAAPPVSSSTYAIGGTSAAGEMVAQNEPAQMAMLNLSGQYRTQAPARDQLQSEGKLAKKSTVASGDKTIGKDEKNADSAALVEESRRAKELGASVSSFSNFKLTQSADQVTLVDAEGSIYVGRMVQTQQAAKQQAVSQKSKTPNRQDVSNLIQQANLVGTNRLTREVVNLVANFYVEPADEEVVSGLRESDARAGGEKSNQAAQAPIRVSVVIERMDLKNNRQEAISNADKFSD